MEHKTVDVHEHIRALSLYPEMPQEVIDETELFLEFLRNSLPHSLFDELVSGVVKQLYFIKSELCGDEWAGRGFMYETMRYLGEFQSSDDVSISPRLN